MDETQTLIAFDFGEKRIGTAIGQTVTRTATPLETIPVRGARPDWNAVDRLVESWKPDALVVGLPLNMDGTDQWITDRARRFANRLHVRSGLPVHLADERLSTREAWTRLIESGSRRGGPDPVAAQVILEGWFAEHGDNCPEGGVAGRPAAARGDQANTGRVIGGLLRNGEMGSGSCESEPADGK